MSTAVLEPPRAVPRPEPAAPRAFHRFAVLTAACAYVLVCAGALVTSTGSSLAVPDWPLSFGTLFPPMVGGVLFEHGHRLIAGTVAAMTLALLLWCLKTQKDRLVRGLVFAASAGIIVQAVLGGVTVLMRLPPAVSIAHACLGQAVFCTLLAAAQASSPWYLSRPARPGGLSWLGLWTVCAVYVQVALGAYLRHTSSGLFYHAGWAVVAAVSLIALSGEGFRSRLEALRSPSALLFALVPVQLALGLAAWKIKSSPDFETGLHPATAATAAHVAVGAALLGTSVIWWLRSRKAS